MRQLIRRDYYTTGEMARILGCSPRLVGLQIDRGQLKGFRPPGRHAQRRCSKAVFRQYLIDHNVPLDQLDQHEQALALAEAFTTPKDNGHG